MDIMEQRKQNLMGTIRQLQAEIDNLGGPGCNLPRPDVESQQSGVSPVTGDIPFTTPRRPDRILPL